MAELTTTVTFRLTEQEKQDWINWCTLQHRSQNDEFRFYLSSVSRKLAKQRKQMSD